MSRKLIIGLVIAAAVLGLVIFVFRRRAMAATDVEGTVGSSYAGQNRPGAFITNLFAPPVPGSSDKGLFAKLKRFQAGPKISNRNTNPPAPTGRTPTPEEIAAARTAEGRISGRSYFGKLSGAIGSR